MSDNSIQSAGNKTIINIITGFLGSGKTTSILNLLKEKQDAAPWAVLVNEFGEIGIDGAILQASGVAIKEVPGGCICCVAGLPMQVALNQLIRTVRPSRILIEPTGLAHLSQLVATLTGGHFADVLDVRATIALLDARKLTDARYTSHEIFNDQLDHADIIIANKAELYNDDDRARVKAWLQAQQLPKLQFAFANEGHFDLRWLDLPASVSAHAHHHHHHAADKPLLPVQLAEGERYLWRENNAADGWSCGWLFAPTLTFSFDRLFALLSGVAAERMKAVMICDRGVFVFNAEGGVLRVQELGEVFDSRIEFINRNPLPRNAIETALLDCSLAA